jgi:hypothetical protein
MHAAWERTTPAKFRTPSHWDQYMLERDAIHSRLHLHIKETTSHADRPQHESQDPHDPRRHRDDHCP